MPSNFDQYHLTKQLRSLPRFLWVASYAGAVYSGAIQVGQRRRGLVSLERILESTFLLGIQVCSATYSFAFRSARPRMRWSPPRTSPSPTKKGDGSFSPNKPPLERWCWSLLEPIAGDTAIRPSPGIASAVVRTARRSVFGDQLKRPGLAGRGSSVWARSRDPFPAAERCLGTGRQSAGAQRTPRSSSSIKIVAFATEVELTTSSMTILIARSPPVPTSRSLWRRFWPDATSRFPTPVSMVAESAERCPRSQAPTSLGIPTSPSYSVSIASPVTAPAVPVRSRSTGTRMSRAGRDDSRSGGESTNAPLVRQCRRHQFLQ